MLLAALLGWLEAEQRDVIAFLREENRVLKAQLGGRRLRLNDDQRRRLAVLGQRLGRGLLREIATLVTPDTILRLCFVNIPTVYDSPMQTFPRQTNEYVCRPDDACIHCNRRRATLSPSSTVTVYPVRAVHLDLHSARRASTVNNPVLGGARPALLCMPVRSQH